MNKFFCIGNFVKDPELSTTKNGINCCKFTLAVDRQYQSGGEKKSDFISFIAWRGTADNINKYCRKGTQVFVDGELQTRTYEAADGTKKYITEIVVGTCKFLQRTVNAQDAQKQPKQSSVEDLQPDDGDLPF